MFEFINYLKLIATVLITNSHFGEIWPISALATGGLLGNVIFFAVSGFLLYDIRTNFFKWFSKRFFRVYPALAIFTTVAVLAGQFPLNSFSDAFKLFVYPTNYIFLVWLLVCYCIFYFVAYAGRKIRNLPEIAMTVLFFVWISVYVFFYDKTAYRVDNVSEPFILFLYMESMLMGALFKKCRKNFLGGVDLPFKIFVTVGCLAVYFISKVLFSKIEALLPLQIVNQFVILITLFAIFDLFMSSEHIFKKIPDKVNCVARHISNITLQIYVVQFVIIRDLDKFSFPFNIIAVVLAIIAVATVLYYIEFLIRKFIDFLQSKARK